MKICSKCGEEKELELFQKNKRYKGGHVGWCKSCVSIYRSQYNATHRAEISAYREQYAANHRVEKAAYAAAHRAEKAAYNKKYMNNRYHTDPAFKLLCNIRSRLGQVIKRNTKSDSTMKLVGCSIEHLKEHLENQFTDGMTWEKVMSGEIHVDHIRPCSLFDLSKEENQRECFNFKNLQPLWAEDNLRKSNKDINQ